MSFFLICALAIASLSGLFLIAKFRARKYPSDAVEVICTMDLVSQASGDLRAYLHRRVINSDKRFMHLQMPGRPALLVKDPESAKVRNRMLILM